MTLSIQLPVATTLTQGEKEGDFFFTEVGDLVYLSFICDTDRKYPDRGCGCGRAYSSLSTGKGTTTAVIAEVAITEDELADRIRQHLIDGEWIDPDNPSQLDGELIAEILEGMLNVGEAFEVGVVIGRNIDDITVRKELA